MQRTAWTDERLNDLAGRMEAGLGRVEGDIRDLRGELHSGLRDLRGELHFELRLVRAEMRALRTEMRTYARR